MTFSKLIVAFLLLNGTIWIYMSYYLAYLGRVDIAETLSKAVVIEVLGEMLVYALKSLLENLSKNNNWPDKPKTEIEDVPRRRVTEIDQPIKGGEPDR